MDEFKDSKNVVIADVDCTTEGKELCSKHGVRGYPTIKYGDPNNLEDYKGGRTLDALKKFAEENLGPTCGPANMDLCDEEKKALIMKFQAMSSADLEAAVKEKEAEQEKAEKDFKDFVEGLNKAYQDKSKEKDDTIAAVKSSGLGMMKAVAADAKTKKHSSSGEWHVALVVTASLPRVAHCVQLVWAGLGPGRCAGDGVSGAQRLAAGRTWAHWAGEDLG